MKWCLYFLQSDIFFRDSDSDRENQGDVTTRLTRSFSASADRRFKKQLESGKEQAGQYTFAPQVITNQDKGVYSNPNG